MRFLTVLAVSPALMALLLTGQFGTRVEGNSLDPACKTPSQPLFEDVESLNNTILYIYNETSRLCSNALIDKNHNNTFKSRFDCVSLCKTGQGAEGCVGDPVNACNNSDIKSYLASKLKTPYGSGNDSQDKLDGESSTEYFYVPGLDDPFEAYFYNVTAEKCQEYLAYEYPNRSLVTNFFLDEEVCEEECSGFNTSNIYGNNSNRMT
ncbi:uncharacterized protein LOC119458584 [Dermacentor silvarum]|uniref:uncharacterized protein LOC119458584 n=1 Tax=Dermacentor silvarum TaxID=543639 RepID=UPI002101C90C|nr:uncharacterized protein LOC119458584 [Dermacentor silvarum]